jgi:hypothetical protein
MRYAYPPYAENFHGNDIAPKSSQKNTLRRKEYAIITPFNGLLGMHFDRHACLIEPDSSSQAF